jgi:hypothetical protein
LPGYPHALLVLPANVWEGALDEQVLRAMARWPNVPAVFGWLRLDRRGQWHLIDRGVPGFDEALHGAGSPITSPPIIEFIERNYTRDDQGRWFWQNGPQRVFVDLDVAPLIIRVLGSGAQARFITHCGHPFGPVQSAHLGDEGVLLLRATQGIGAVHDLDLGALAIEQFDEALTLHIIDEQGRRALRLSNLPKPAGFERRPRP